MKKKKRKQIIICHFVFFRFCSKLYEPFDEKDVDKYVVGDDYIPIWKMPSLKKSYNERKFGMKETLNAYIKKIGNGVYLCDVTRDVVYT